MNRDGMYWSRMTKVRPGLVDDFFFKIARLVY